MSLARTVAELIEERGSATADELLAELSGFTRKQVIDALKNARAEGLVHCLGLARLKGAPLGKASVPARHYPGQKPEESKPERVICTRPPNSAWELALGRQIAGAWPPSGNGKRFQPLGGWTEEAA